MKRLWIAVVMLWPLVAHANEPCANDHFMHAIDPALGHMACQALPSVAFARGQSARVLHPGTLARPANQDETTAVSDVGEILSRAATAAGQVRMPLPDKLTVFLDPNPPGGENRAAQLTQLEAAQSDGAAARGECLLAYHYRGGDGFDKKFEVAHQLFHCMVKKTWEEARLAAGESNWWAEGSADFFASIVYPEFGMEADGEHFMANEGQLLFERNRDAAVLFDWYSTGAGKLKRLVGIVQEAPPGAVILDLMDEIGGNNWLDFEEKYYDHQIHSPNGHVAVEPHKPAAQRISSTTTKTFRATPYAIRAATLEFAEGKTYELDGGTENDFHWKWSEGDGGGWEDAPRVVHTCHQTKKYRVVFAGKDREVDKQLRITARDERESDCPCVVGSWNQTSASLARVAARLQSRGIRNASCSFVGGGTQLTFTAEHNGGEEYQGLHTVCTSPTSNSEGTTNGTRAFTWADTSATQLTMTSAGGNASSHIVVTVHGHASAMDAPLTGAGAGAVTYRCTRTDLHLEYPGVNGTDSFDYTRAH